MAAMKDELEEDRARKLKAALQWTYKLSATAAKAFGKGHPESALACAAAAAAAAACCVALLR